MTTMFTGVLAAVVVALMGFGAGTAGAGHRPNNEVLIGGAISQTGRYAEPAGRQVNAIKLYEKLITEDKVDILLAPYSSGITEAVANVNERYKMPFVAFGAASTPIWEKGRKYIFSIVDIAENYQKGAVHLARQIGVKRAAIIGEDSLFPRQSAKGAKDWAKKLGIDIVVEENYPIKQTDFTALLQKIRGAGAEAIFSNSYFADAAAQLRQLREQNINLKLFSSTVGPGCRTSPSSSATRRSSSWGSASGSRYPTCSSIRA